MSAAAVDTLTARANRAAAAVVAEHGLGGGRVVSYDLLVSLIALGWCVGWSDGFEQAIDEARKVLA